VTPAAATAVATKAEPEPSTPGKPPGAALEAPKEKKKQELTDDAARKQRSLTMLLVVLVVGGAFLAAKANGLI
jgi:hypothetical protein